MPFRFNPFTDNLDIVDTTVGPGPVLTIEGNSGGPVPPTGGQITLVGSGGVNVAGNPGTSTLTITVSDLGMTWTDIGLSQALLVDNGYFCTSGGTLLLSLPAASNIGDTIIISLDGSAGFQITQGAGQSIKIANKVTTTGVAGSIASTQQGDTVTLVCSVANLRWNGISSIGNFTFA